MSVSREVFGGLTCRIVDRLAPGENPKRAFILCHGFGAPGTDLVPLADEFFRLAPPAFQTTRFVFPEAPLSLEEWGMYGARAWWMIDPNRLNRAMETGKVDEVREDCNVGLPPARRQFLGMLDELLSRWSLSANQLILGGFSQGAMLATDIALRLPEPPALLCILSGTLVLTDEWQQLTSQRKSLRIVQSHGTSDPILPYSQAERLHEMLRGGGLEIEFLSFPGPHTIPFEAIKRIAEVVSAL